jgi:DNA polymerase IIIc chi subunit
MIEYLECAVAFGIGISVLYGMAYARGYTNFSFPKSRQPTEIAWSKRTPEYRKLHCAVSDANRDWVFAAHRLLAAVDYAEGEESIAAARAKYEAAEEAYKIACKALDDYRQSV